MEKIAFEKSENGISITYVSDRNSNDRILRFDASTNELYFVENPNVRYPISNLTKDGFNLLNPDGRSQYFQNENNWEVGK